MQHQPTRWMHSTGACALDWHETNFPSSEDGSGPTEDDARPSDRVEMTLEDSRLSECPKRHRRWHLPQLLRRTDLLSADWTDSTARCSSHVPREAEKTLYPKGGTKRARGSRGVSGQRTQCSRNWRQACGGLLRARSLVKGDRALALRD